MLVGSPPWEFPRDEDPRFRIIADGGLSRILAGWNRSISPEAEDLLQSMLRPDPKKRLTLEQVQNHPWVLAESENPAEDPAASDEGGNQGVIPIRQ